MLFNLKLYYETIFIFYSCYITNFITNFSLSKESLFRFTGFSLLVQIYHLENLQDPKLFNYFYLCRYFFGHYARIFKIKKYFVLGKHYHNIEIGFHLKGKQMFLPLSIWIFQVQSGINLSLTRDFMHDGSSLQWILRDTSIFPERKTNTGLFDLSDPLRFHLTYREQKNPLYIRQQLFRCFKIILN